MNKEQKIAKIITLILNPLFLTVYVFIFYLLLMVVFNGYANVGQVVLKSITLYILVSCLLPIFILYLFNNNSFHDFKERTKNSNSSYIIVSISYFISYLYFSILNISVWFDMGLLIPIYTTLAVLILRKKMTISIDIITIGAITFYIFFLTIKYYYVFSIFPLLIAILLSGLLTYAYQIQNLTTPKQSVQNYLIGCLITLSVAFFVLII
jgi:hypothetical protein